MPKSKGLYCEQLLLPSGWASDMAIVFDTDGVIADIRSIESGDDFQRAAGPVLPGMPNLHSHAFQRAIAGLTEATGPGGDDFWTWRQAVYRFVSQLTPADVEAIAAQLYVDMLKGGYTTVGESIIFIMAPTACRTTTLPKCLIVWRRRQRIAASD